MTKAIAYLTTLVSFLLLGACATQPRLTAEQQQSQSAVTLNVYADNRVAFKDVTVAQLTYWHWTSDKDRILALTVNGKLFNAKDLVNATSTETERNSNVYALAFEFKDGHKELAKARFRFGPTWLVCNRAKVCQSESFLTDADYNKSLGDVVTAVREIDLQRTNLTQSLNVSLLEGYAGAPRSGGTPNSFSRLTVLSDAERETLLQRINSVENARSGYAKDQIDTYNRQKREKEAFIQEEASRMRKTVRIGTQTNCGNVFELRLPLVGVQTMYGTQYLQLSDLFGPTADCRFVNHQYVGR